MGVVWFVRNRSAKMKLKPGAEEKIMQVMEGFAALTTILIVAFTINRLDAVERRATR